MMGEPGMRRKLTAICYGLGFFLVLGHGALAWAFTGEIPLEKQSPPPSPGTVITHANWQQYKDYMTLGQQLLWEGKMHWKYAPFLKWKVVPTKPAPIPPYFKADTEKYSGQVRLKKLPNGGTALENYVAGLPFPQITEPDAGAKVLQNVFYRWHSFVHYSGAAFSASVDRFGNASDSLVNSITHRLAFLSDPEMPHTVPGSAGEYYTGEQYILEPETAKYVTQLNVFWVDPTQPEGLWSFIPSLRRVLRLSASARCSPSVAGDLYREDTHGGFYGGNYRFVVELVAHKKLLVDTNFSVLKGAYPSPEEVKAWGIYDYIPQPPDAEWEVHDAWVIDLKPTPDTAAGYCYQHKTIYVDGGMWAPVGTENYDSAGKLWKISNFRFTPDPDGYGNFTEGGEPVGFEWIDVQNDHSTQIVNGHPHSADGRAAPEQFRSIERWSLPSGLAMILQ